MLTLSMEAETKKAKWFAKNPISIPIMSVIKNADITGFVFFSLLYSVYLFPVYSLFSES